jgi:hypothetical protein
LLKINNIFYEIIISNKKNIVNLSETMNYVIMLNEIYKNLKYIEIVKNKYEKMLLLFFKGN